jgi:hypothetical protein
MGSTSRRHASRPPKMLTAADMPLARSICRVQRQHHTSRALALHHSSVHDSSDTSTALRESMPLRHTTNTAARTPATSGDASQWITHHGNITAMIRTWTASVTTLWDRRTRRSAGHTIALVTLGRRTSTSTSTSTNTTTSITISNAPGRVGDSGKQLRQPPLQIAQRNVD